MWFSLIIGVSLLTGVNAAVIPITDSSQVVQEACDQLRARRRAALQQRNGMTSSERQRIVSAAMTQYLVLAETVLRRGERLDTPVDAGLVNFGLTMLDTHVAVDALLASEDPSRSPEVERVVRGHLVSFTQQVRSGLPRLRRSDEPLGLVRGWLRPLRAAVEALTDRSAPESWWSVAEVSGESPRESTVRPPVVAELPEDLATLILTQAAAGRPAVASAAAALLNDLASRTWVSGPARRAVHASVRVGLQAVESGTLEPDQALQRLRHLHEVLESLVEFARSPGGRSVVSRRSEALVELIEAWDGELPRTAPSRAVAEGLRLLARSRVEQEADAHPDRKRTHALLKRQRHLTEQRLVDSFPDIARSPAPWTDPSLVVVLAAPRDLLEAMQRARRLEEWTTEAKALNPDEAANFTARLTMLVDRMIEDETREDAAAALTEFERQRRLFRDLREATSDGRGMSRRLANAGARWVRDWAAGRSTGPGAQAMYRLYRISDHLRCVRAITNSRITDLDRWAAWQLPRSAIVRWRDDYDSRIQDLMEMLGDGEDEAVDETLAALDRRFAHLQLIAVLAERRPVSEEVHRALTAMGELTDAPSPRSVLGSEEPSLAALGLGLQEIAVREASQELTEDDPLWAWCLTTAATLRQRVARLPAAPIEIPGMGPEITPARRRGGGDMMR